MPVNMFLLSDLTQPLNVLLFVVTVIVLVGGYYLVKFDFVTLDSGRLNLTVSLGGQLREGFT